MDPREFHEQLKPKYNKLGLGGNTGLSSNESIEKASRTFLSKAKVPRQQHVPNIDFFKAK